MTAEKITLTDGDLICLCGNDPTMEGFFSCLDDGTPVEPADPGQWQGRLYVCGRCGRIIDYPTQEVRGHRDVQEVWAMANGDANVALWAGVLMAEIHNDMRQPFPWGKQIPRNVGSFSLLHDYCDANMLLDADPALMELALRGLEDDEANATVNAVLDEVNARLAAEAKQISDGLADGRQLDYGVIDGDMLDEQRAHWNDREPAAGYSRRYDCPQYSGSLEVGMRVTVERRGGITGVVSGFSTDNTVTPPKPLASITFDDGQPGLNYVSDCTPVPWEQQPRSWQIGEKVKTVTGFVLVDKSGLPQDQQIGWYITHAAGDMDAAAQAEIRNRVTVRLATEGEQR